GQRRAGLAASATRAPQPTTPRRTTHSSPPSRLRRLIFSPAAAAATPAAALPSAVLRPFLNAVRSEDAGAAVTSASLAALHEVMALMGPSLTSAALREWVCRQLPVRGRGRGRRRGGRADADAAVTAHHPARTRRHRVTFLISYAQDCYRRWIWY
ncbi:Os12g0559100, partial [Oryza sativa Japonica Group]